MGKDGPLTLRYNFRMIIESSYYRQSLSGPSPSVERFEKILTWVDQCIPQHRKVAPSFDLDSDLDLLNFTHDENYLKEVIRNPAKAIKDAYQLSEELPELDALSVLHSHLAQVKSTVYAAEMALISGLSFHVGGGMHHGKFDRPNGFCLFNDIIIAFDQLKIKKKIRKACCIDVDAHRGDGLSEMASQREDFIILDMFLSNTWPSSSENRSYADIERAYAPDSEDTYLYQLESALMDLAENAHEVDLLFVNLGSDVFYADELESSKGIKLSAPQMLKRDLLIDHFAQKMKIPRVYLMSGGYGASSHIPYINFLNALRSEGLFTSSPRIANANA